jgi:ABC-2 type transport system permease protein
MLMSLLVLTRDSPPDAAESLHILSGVLLAAFWSSCVWSSVGVLRRDRQNGTLAASVTSTRDPREVLLGRVLGACLPSLAGTLATVVLVAAVLGLRPEVAHPVAIVTGLATTVLTGTAASLLVGAVLLVSRHGDHISSAIGVPVTLLGGTVVPVGVLPDVLRPVPSLVSLSWLQRWFSTAAGGALDWSALAVAAGLTVVYAGAAATLLMRALSRARLGGSLELY